MDITIIGTGYVGLVSGICFAEMGHDVTCVDVDRRKLTQLRNGALPIYEPGLASVFERVQRERRIRFTSHLGDAVTTADIVILALPTPPAEDGSADLSYVLGVAHQLAEIVRPYTVIVTKSTVPVGTADRISKVFTDAGRVAGVDFDVVSNPEFLREGSAVEDFMRPDRIVIGTASERAAAVMQELYEPFVRQGNPVLTMDVRSSELTKYAANAFLATKISFVNEVAQLCERVGANVDHVRRGMGTDQRIGKQFLYPGLGFGGSCFPKDVRALQRTATGAEYQFRILDAVLDVNARQSDWLVERIVAQFGGDLRGRRIAVWGLAFKANTDDVRESPAIRVIEALLEHGADVVAYDPVAMITARRVLESRIDYASDAYDALVGTDALVIATEWPAFRRPNFTTMRRLLTSPYVFDGRNLYDPKEMARHGLVYTSIGRPDGSEPTPAPTTAVAV